MRFVFRFLFLIAATMSIHSARAELNYPLVPNSEVDAYNGFNQSMERTAASRAAVLRELVALGEKAAKQGIAYSPDEWKDMARMLGGGFLSSNVPTNDALAATWKVQNAQAEMVRKSRSTEQSSAPSERWLKKIHSNIARNGAPSDFYVDLNTRRALGSNILIWSVTDFSALMQNQGKEYRSIAELLETDCPQNAMRLKTVVVFSEQMARGTIVHKNDREQNWANPNHSERYSALYRFLCDK